MMKKLYSKINFYEISQKLIKYWKENNIFEKTNENKNDKRFVFIDGPPFVTGMPHYGTLLSSIAKDTVTRFWSMKGYYVRRVWGWDCHGLPIEEQVSKKFGLKNKKDIETFGISNYVRECREFIEDITEKWRWYIESIGRWVDMDNAYYTMKPEFNESVIWLFKQAWDKGYIYKGKRVSLYSTDTGTPVSDFEVAESNNYKDVDDLSIFVKFKIKENDKNKSIINLPKNTFIVAWTTTPWTIPSNFALAINANEEYVVIEKNGEYLILAKKRYEYTFGTEQVSVIKTLQGSDIIGLEYEKIYDFFDSDKDADFKIYDFDGVNMDEGTGVLHIAPGFGEEDFLLGQQLGLSDFQDIDDEGKMIVGEWKGVYLRDANDLIANDLESRNLLLKKEIYTHRLAFFRGNNPLIYKAQDAYYIDIEKIRDRVLQLNEKINWYPQHLKKGRFYDIVKNSPDWCISRTRYWATIMPLWRSKDGDELVVGSIEEMSKFNVNIRYELSDGKKIWYYKDRKLYLHRDICDDIILYKDGKEYFRVKDVLDCWLDSGSVPFAEYSYPFNEQNKEIFEKNFPADFITEYIGQTRAWFNVLLKVSTIVFDDIPVKNILTTGNLSGTDGRKMSKSFKNYPDPEETIKKYGGDALRLYLLGSPLLSGNDIAFNEQDLKIQTQEILLPLVNIYQFLSTYAEINNFEITNNFIKKFKLNDTFITENPSKLVNDISNKWMINKIVEFNKKFSDYFEHYEIQKAVKIIKDVIADISKWYIRINRDSFNDKERSIEFMETLSYVLIILLITTAPVMPFITEEIFMNLINDTNISGESIHLHKFIHFSDFDLDEDILEQITLTQSIIELGNEIRGANNIKSRQPLSKMYVNKNLTNDIKKIVLKELNIKTFAEKEIMPNDNIYVKENKNNKHSLIVQIDTYIYDDLLEEGIVRDIIRQIQLTRKESGKKYGEVVKIDITCNQQTKNIINRSTNHIESATNVQINNVYNTEENDTKVTILG